MHKPYEKIILAGTGTLFLQCLCYVKETGIEYMGFDMSEQKPLVTMTQAQKKELNYLWMEKEAVFDWLRKEKKKTLLLSVINPYIVPGDILNRENMFALNIHQALLPAHRGRNAEAWAIFEGDKVTGITWHKMTARVDEGDILAQKEIVIDENTTSFGLFRQQLSAAYEAFEEFMPEVLAGREQYITQQDLPEQKENQIRFLREVPAGGRIDPGWSGEELSRFLRAMDYGILKIMPEPVLFLEGKRTVIKSWRICRTKEKTGENLIKDQGNYVEIVRGNYIFTLKKRG